jgi:hypothetical protein
MWYFLKYPIMLSSTSNILISWSLRLANPLVNEASRDTWLCAFAGEINWTTLDNLLKSSNCSRRQ